MQKLSGSMLDRLIALSLNHRPLVLLAALLMFLIGLNSAIRQPVDVFPDLNRPVVTLLAEVPGLAAEDVEAELTMLLEATILGVPGVTGVRSSSRRGLVMVRAEFEWGTDIYLNRQAVMERVDVVRGELSDGVKLQLGPISSIMGEIMLIGLLPAEGSEVTLRQLRSYADWSLRRRLVTIVGVSNVTVIGGEVLSYVVELDGDALARLNLTVSDVESALRGVSKNSGGGFFERDGSEYVFRNIGAIYHISEIESAVIGYHGGRVVRLAQVASVVEGSLPSRGSAGVHGREGVVVAVQKQPHADTIALARQISAELEQLQQSESAAGILIKGELFVQADFIERSIDNLRAAMRDASLMVVLVLMLFLWNLRTTMVTIVALPLSIVAGILVLTALDFGINTMTLGGIAVAIGELVDDAIVDVENCYRRLKENALSDSPRPLLEVVYSSSSEIRNSIVLATMTVVLVFLPLLFLDGIEGRLFQPLAIAYIVTILSSLLIALTVTPVLSYYILPSRRYRQQDTRVVSLLKRLQRRNLQRLLDRPLLPLAVASMLFFMTLLLLPLLPRTFLPDFNEGTLTIELINAAGTSLSRSVERAKEVESLLFASPYVTGVARRTGRAEMDEHAEGVHYSEFDVTLEDTITPAERRRFIADLRRALEALDGVASGIGQPISHRLDHMLAGIRSEVAVVIYGQNLRQLQHQSYLAEEILRSIEGVADLRSDISVDAPEYMVMIDHLAASHYGVEVPKLIETLQTAQGGSIVGRVRMGEQLIPVMLRLDTESRDIDQLSSFTLKHLPDGTAVRLADVADLFESEGPYEIWRDNGERRIALQLNSSGRSLEGLVHEIERRLAEELPQVAGVRYELTGRYRSAIESGRRVALLSGLAFLMVALLLYLNYHSVAITAQILLSLPFAFIGGAWSLIATSTPLSIASLVGFVALAGIAARNSILMISHFEHLIRAEGAAFGRETIIRGALERLVPVLMTAGTAVLALLPVVVSGAHASGKELIYPVALVISGGLVSSTLLDLTITPVIYYQLARRFGLYPMAESSAEENR